MRRTLPLVCAILFFMTAAALFIYGVHMVKDGIFSIPGFSDEHRLAPTIAGLLSILPTVFQAYLLDRFRVSETRSLSKFVLDNLSLAVVVLFLTAIEVNFVRLGLGGIYVNQEKTVIYRPIQLLLLGESFAIALGSKVLLLLAWRIAKTELGFDSR